MSDYAVSAFWARAGLGLMLGAFVAALFIWGFRDLDLIARQKLAGNSVSKTIQAMLYSTPPGVLIAVTIVIVLIVGVLLGHFGWPQYKVKP